MNKQFIITNFAAFALMLFLPTGCRQAEASRMRCRVIGS